MRVLVTRPERPAARTKGRLEAAGHDVLLAPLLELHFDPPAHLIGENPPEGIVLTSANAAHALTGHPDLQQLIGLPLWTVGSRTSAAAREIGFTNLRDEAPDVASLGALLVALPRPIRLAHFAGEDRAGDLAALVAPAGHEVRVEIVYRASLRDALPAAVIKALRARRIDAVLHYSRRTAGHYLALAERSDILSEALAPLHVCLSDQVAEPLRSQGGKVRVAETPDEDALFTALGQDSSPRQALDEALDRDGGNPGTRMSMADPKNPGSGSKESRPRSMKPKPQTIDLAATEIEAEPAAESRDSSPGLEDPAPPSTADDPPIPENDPPPVNELADAEPRSSFGALVGAGLAGAAIAIILFVLLLVTDLLPVGRAGDPELASRFAGLETEVRSLAASKTDTPPVPQAVNVAASLEAIRGEMQASASSTAALDTRLNTLEQTLGALGGRLDALATSSANATSPEALDRLSARIDELSAQQREPDPALQQAAAEAKRASLLVSISAIESALARRTPYEAALADVHSNLPDVQVTALASGAAQGLPDLRVLARSLAADLNGAPPPPSAATGLVDRFFEGARSLVKVRPAGSAANTGADPWSVRARISGLLEQGDYEAALAQLSSLDPAAQDATRESAAALRTRIDADKALDDLRAAALAGART